ncbi:MAG: hypothetical protein NTV97_32435 [Alphaproteobacteria bacterium]|nr:hypothetical protein [Alphaproteobacteria bacterium]
METAGGFLCCAVALVLGIYIGRRWASGTEWAVLFGVVAGTLCVAFYLIITSWIGMLWPEMLDAHVLGLHLIVVGMASPVCGALGALLGYRWSLGQRPF